MPKVKATYFQNNSEAPIVYGDVEIINPKRRRLRGEQEKEGVIAETVMAGFCGTDFELMRMSENCQMTGKFPPGQNRLINGHEGVVFVPGENRFAIVLIRGGDSYDPTRYEDNETYFEYGCDGADGLMSEKNYYHPDMLLHIPDKYIKAGKLPLSTAKKLVFSDPYACMLFQYERMADLGSAHLYRLEMRKNSCDEAEARKIAVKSVFKRTVIFGLGTTGMFIGDIIKKNNPEAEIVFVARSPVSSLKVKFALEKTNASYIENNFKSEKELADEIIKTLRGHSTVFIGVSGSAAEHRLAFEYGVLGNNGLYNSFSLGPKIEYDSMPFGFKNHLIFGSINFRQDHMEEAIGILCESDYDKIVDLIQFDEFAKNPKDAYINRIYAKNSPLKTAVVWNEHYLDINK